MESIWDIDEYLEPHELLAKKVEIDYLERAINLNLDFCYLNNINNFGKFIQNSEKLFEFSLENLNSESEEVKKLIYIRDYNSSVNLNEDNILLYNKFCYTILNHLEG
jgi:hypothetical protein